LVSKRRQVFDVAGDRDARPLAELEEAVAWRLKQVPAAPESIFENAYERPRSASPHSASGFPK
jgi:hypothetical protein